MVHLIPQSAVVERNAKFYATIADFWRTVRNFQCNCMVQTASAANAESATYSERCAIDGICTPFLLQWLASPSARAQIEHAVKLMLQLRVSAFGLLLMALVP